MKEKIVLWGLGNIGKGTIKCRWAFEDSISIVAIIDNSKSLWNTELDDIKIYSPKDIKKLQYDKVVVTTSKCFDEIEMQLVGELGVERKNIENYLYFAKKKLIARYKNSINSEIKSIIQFLETNRLDVFNYRFVEKYLSMEVEINYDDNCGLFYVMHNDKKMYMAKKFNTEEKVSRYYREVCMEQDKDSPHAYLSSEFNVGDNDVVVDVGVAEGNFALSVIDRVSRIYLIESDQEWIEALTYTFSEYKDKIIILNKFISDYAYFNTETLDDLIDEEVDFIKMDIEGAEVEAIKGAQKLLERSSKVKCAVCTYHRENDEECIRGLVTSLGLKCKAVAGYMYYPIDVKQLYVSPTLSKGVVRCEK